MTPSGCSETPSSEYDSRLRRFRLRRSCPEHPPGDCIEPGGQGRVTPVGRGYNRMIERSITAAWTWAALLAETWYDLPHQVTCPVGVAEQDADDGLNRDVVMVR